MCFPSSSRVGWSVGFGGLVGGSLGGRGGLGDLFDQGDGLGVFLRHRFAAAGNRDNTVDSTNSDVSVGFLGRVADKIDVEIAARRTEYKGYELGRGYIVDSLAATAAADGIYSLVDPFGNSQQVLNSIQATINRDTQWLGK